MSARSSPKQPSPEPAGLALWTFLWGAGCRRLHLSTRGIPGARDVVVSSLPELLNAVEDERTSARVLAGLDYQLQAGFLERWLLEGIDKAAAAVSARSIREDPRALKLERWLQGAGLSTYFIGERRIDSVHDLASLPERGGDLPTLWEHIREGVPQERFKDNQAVVRVLEEVRVSNDVPERAKPLIACLRLGLQRLPWADRFLETVGDLEPAILQPGGREALLGLLESGVLQAWVDTVAPRRAGLVATARGMDPAIAVDRAVRGVLGPAVYPVPGVKAADYAELLRCAGSLFHVLCGDPEPRARLRDALFGPIRLPGAPSDLVNPPEAELVQLSRAQQANIFAWTALKLPVLHLGANLVQSVDEYLVAIARPRDRAAAIELASTGVVSLWYRLALGKSLSEALSGSVSEQAFPALCLEMGEPPPSIGVTWSSASVNIPDGGTAVFQALLTNRDPVRTAVLALSADTKPQRGRVSFDSQVVLPPGTTITTQLTYPSPPGIAGQTHIAVAISHAGPRPVTVLAKDLLVTAGFPWQAVLAPTLGWMVLVPAVVALLRCALQPLVGALLYRADAFELRKPPDSTMALVGLGIAAVCFAIEHAVIARRYRQFWPPKPAEATLGPVKIAAVMLTVVAIFVGHQRGLSTGMLLGIAAVGACVVQLSQKDLVGAALFSGWLFIGKELGGLFLLAVGGLDTIAIMAARMFSISGPPSSLAVLGWVLCGAFLGLAFGAAVALRGVNRPLEAEATRIVILVIVASLLVLRGTAAAPARDPTGSVDPWNQSTRMGG